MRKHSPSLADSSRGPLPRDERGVALLTTLLLLLLLTALAVTMVLAVSSDMLLNRYFSNSRGSFYAADSGANIVRQVMVNGATAAVGAFSTTAQPIGNATTTASAILNSLQSTYGASFAGAGNIIGGSSAAGSQAATAWPASFKMDTATTSLNFVNCSVVSDKSTATCAAPVGNVTAYNYQFQYKISTWGQSAGGGGQVRIDDYGYINIAATLPGGTQKNASSYGTFLDQYASCSSPFVNGTLTGPFFTNGEWNFGAGGYLFTDKVESHSTNASFWTSNNSCTSRNASSYGGITPTFQQGFDRGVPKAKLPVNDYNQKQAVLDGRGSCGNDPCPNPTNSAMHDKLRNVSTTQYSSSGESTGVWLPYSTSASTCGTVTPPCFTGGGILVEGPATSVKLTASGSTAQVYTIVQGTGSNVTTTTITIDPSANTTVVSSAGATVGTVTINGVPREYDPNTGANLGPATMLYVDGAIGSSSSDKGLSGPGEGVPAVQDNTAITITANGTITVTGDILYKTQPVTHDTSDTLTSNHAQSGVLGIFTATGDIQMDNQQSDQYIEVDASIAMLSDGGSGGWLNVGNPIKTMTLVGGRIANQAKPNHSGSNVNARNIWYDRRFMDPSFAPPWFPTVTLEAPPNAPAQVIPSIQRTYWAVQSSYN